MAGTLQPGARAAVGAAAPEWARLRRPLHAAAASADRSRWHRGDTLPRVHERAHAAHRLVDVERRVKPTGEEIAEGIGGEVAKRRVLRADVAEAGGGKRAVQLDAAEVRGIALRGDRRRGRSLPLRFGGERLARVHERRTQRSASARLKGAVTRGAP